MITGKKAAAASVICTFMENMIPRYSTIRKQIRNTSGSCLHTKLRITSTSEVHLWMISPVWCFTCQEKGRYWVW